MKFTANGPSIPNELLVARDAGDVIIFCGAGVSQQEAGLPSFAGLGREVTRQGSVVPATVFEMSVPALLSKGLHNALPAGFLQACASVEFSAINTRRLVVAGKFDHAAIMIAAAAARKHQARYGSTWAMSMGLRAAWTVAKLAHRNALHRHP